MTTLARRASEATARRGALACDVCAEEIPRGVSYHMAMLSPRAAAGWLDVDDPETAPTWTRFPCHTVCLVICLGCWNLMGDPYSTIRAQGGGSVL